MFRSKTDREYHPLLPGVGIKTRVVGERTLLAEIFLQKGCGLPRHSHPHEQTGYMISGHFRLVIGDQAYDTHPGDSWSIPGGTEHEVEVLEDTVVIEVFSPVREDYLPYRD